MIAEAQADRWWQVEVKDNVSARVVYAVVPLVTAGAHPPSANPEIGITA